MATTRQRRAGANPPIYNDDDDRVYTEDDYAMPESAEAMPDEWEAEQAGYAAAGWTGEEFLPDEAFRPDEAEYPEDAEWAEESPEAYEPFAAGGGYAPFFDEGADFDEELDPLSDELLTDEERAELKRGHWQLIAGLMDFAGVIVGTAAILVLVTLLVSLLNWLINDMSQSFILLQKNL